MTATEVAKAFGVKRIGSARKWRAKCPAHKSRGLTLAIYDDGDKVGVYCHAGCLRDDVLAAVGLSWKDLRPRREMTPEIRRRASSRQKLERLDRQYGLMLWLSLLEPSKRRYWEAAMRRVRADVEPLYWEVNPDAHKYDRATKDDPGRYVDFDMESYRIARMDWIREKGSTRE